MVFTLEQFKNQYEYWEDKLNFFAIHKTCGGAVYLLRVEKEYPTQKLNDKLLQGVTTIRIDGINYNIFYEHIKSYIN